MSDQAHHLAWNLYCELRRELVEAQKIRAQVLGFKITFVSAGIGIILANSREFPIGLLVIPAFASIFFDLLITSYSFSIRRTGFYLRTHIEPVLYAGYSWSSHPLWEEFMASPAARENLSFWGNLGLTLLSVAAAIAGLLTPSSVAFPFHWRILLLFLLLLFAAVDVWTFFHPRRMFALSGKALAP